MKRTVSIAHSTEGYLVTYWEGSRQVSESLLTDWDAVAAAIIAYLE